MLDMYVFALEEERLDMIMKSRLRSYGVSDEQIRSAFDACTRKAVTTKYSRRQLLQAYINDIIVFGQPNLSQFIFE